MSNFGTYFEGERATQRMKITETYIPKFKISTLRGNAIKQGKCGQGQPEFLHQHEHQHLPYCLYIYKHLLRKGKSVGVGAVAGASTSNDQSCETIGASEKKAFHVDSI